MSTQCNELMVRVNEVDRACDWLSTDLSWADKTYSSRDLASIFYSSAAILKPDRRFVRIGPAIESIERDLPRLARYNLESLVEDPEGCASEDHVSNGYMMAAEPDRTCGIHGGSRSRPSSSPNLIETNNDLKNVTRFLRVRN